MSNSNQAELLERYRLLSELSRDVASTLDLATLLRRIVDAAANLCGAEAASILLYDEAKKQLHFEVTNNLEQPMMRGMIVPVNSIAGWIATERKPTIISDVQSDPRHFKSVDRTTQMTTASILGVPMIANDKVVGVLEAINKLGGNFSLEDQDLMMALASQAAIAIENARLFQQSDLISELVHELRTPLTSLNTAARLLQNPKTPVEMHINLLEMILSETGRLSEMTTAFLDLARLESARAQFEVSNFPVQPLFKECAAILVGKAQEKNVEIKLDVPPDLPELRADRGKIKQVLINLLSNAIKYNREDGEVCLQAACSGSEMTLAVRDTGFGIPPDALPHLFQKFYRVPGLEKKAQGTGLGLAICQRIADAHNGRIEVQSQVGEGTTFSVFLPLVGGVGV